MNIINRRQFFALPFMSAVQQRTVGIEPFPNRCRVCDSVGTLQHMGLAVTGVVQSDGMKRTQVRDDLPPKQFCSKCGAERVNTYDPVQGP